MNSFTPKGFINSLVESIMIVLGWTNTTERLIYIQGKMHDQLNSWEHYKYKLRRWETLNLEVTLEIWLSLSFHLSFLALVTALLRWLLWCRVEFSKPNIEISIMVTKASKLRSFKASVDYIIIIFIIFLIIFIIMAR